MSFLANWRPRHLAAAWGVYWLGLAAATLGDAIEAVWHVTHLPAGQGSVSLMFGDGLLTLVSTASGLPTFTGSVPATTLALAIAGPPLALWLLWLLSRPKRTFATEGEARALDGRDQPRLDAPRMNAGDLPGAARQRTAAVDRAEFRPRGDD